MTDIRSTAIRALMRAIDDYGDDITMGQMVDSVIPIIQEDTELNIMSEEGKLKWVADAIIADARKPLVEMIYDLVQQACYMPPDGMGEPYLDSMALSVYADAMRFLAGEGKIKITSQYGRRVIGEKIKDE